MSDPSEPMELFLGHDPGGEGKHGLVSVRIARDGTYDFLTEHGAIEPGRIYDSPFTGVAPRVPKPSSPKMMSTNSSTSCATSTTLPSLDQRESSTSRLGRDVALMRV